MNDIDYFTDDKGVLKNRLGIKDADQLEFVERQASQERANIPIINFEVSYDGYKAVHKHLFGDVYEWAGQSRGEPVTIDGEKHYSNLGQVMRKGSSVFARTDYIEDESKTYFKEFALTLENHQLKGSLSEEVFAENLAKHIGDVNFIHAFREGNGRTMRLYMQHVGQEYGFNMTALSFDKDRWMDASAQAMNDSHLPLKQLILEHLSIERQRGDDREIEVSIEEAGKKLADKLGRKFVDFDLQEPRNEVYYGYLISEGQTYLALSQGTDFALAKVDELPELNKGLVTLSRDNNRGALQARQAELLKANEVQLEEEQEIER